MRKMQCARPTAKSIYKLILILKNNSARSVRLRNDLQIKAAGLGSGPTRPYPMPHKFARQPRHLYYF